MTTKSELQQQVISLYDALKELEPDTKRDASIFQQAIDNPDWVGPAKHFKPDEEVIQVRTLHDLLKGSLRKGDTIGNLVLVPEETAELALFPMQPQFYQVRVGDHGIGADGLPSSPYEVHEHARSWTAYSADQMRAYRRIITDEMIERAAIALRNIDHGGPNEWGLFPEYWKDRYRDKARAALEAGRSP